MAPINTPAPQQEGGRWRYSRPSSEEVAEWFRTVPLDEGMDHADFVNGIVIIPAQEKVKKQVDRNGVLATQDVHEMTFTPYVRVDTRVTYFRKLAAKSSQIAVIEPIYVPRIEGDHPANNTNLPPGFWWFLAPAGNNSVRFLCCTMRVALYREEDWFAQPREVSVSPAEGKPIEPVAHPRPVREGVATKQVPVGNNYGPDQNALAKAETGAVGRALGMAGVLVVGTGIATAEDLAELSSSSRDSSPELPEAVLAPAESPEQLAQRLISLQAQLSQEFPSAWAEFAKWWQERMKAESWTKIEDAPIEVRRGIATRLEDKLEELRAEPPSL